MSQIIAQATKRVEDIREGFPETFVEAARKRVQERKEPPANEEEMALAMQGEIRSVFYDEVRKEAQERWTDMFRKAFQESAVSYRKELEAARLDAFRRTHRYEQSELFFRLAALFRNEAESERGHFDDRNLWVRDAAARITFAINHPQEMDTLMAMDDNQLRDLRLQAPRKEQQ